MFRRRDPAEALKQSIRDLEDQVPAMNEALALLKAQATLAEGDLQKVRARERELLDKVGAALADGRHDIAANYALALADVRREVERLERKHEVASEAFARGLRHKREFTADKEQRIAEARDALAAARAAEWTEQVAAALHVLRRSRDRSAGEHAEALRRLRECAAGSEALLARELAAVDDAADLEPEALRAILETLARQVERLEERLGWTRRHVEALRERLRPPAP